MQEHMEMGAECMSDVVLLLGQMKQMSLPDLLDHRISKYQREQRVSLGWVICIWLAYIMSKGDHPLARTLGKKEGKKLGWQTESGSDKLREDNV